MSRCGFEGNALHEADDLPGEHDGEERTDEVGRRKIADRERKDDQVADEIDALQRLAHQLVQRHGQCIIAAGCAARADAETHADADKERTDDGSYQRHAGQLGPERRGLLKERIEQGEAAACDDGIENEHRAERPEAEEIARGIEHEAGCGWRDAQPVVQKQREPENAALRDTGKGVHIVQAEG